MKNKCIVKKVFFLNKVIREQGYLENLGVLNIRVRESRAIKYALTNAT